MLRIIFTLLLLTYSAITLASAETSNKFDVIQLYTQDELNVLIRNNKHLQRVKTDECQLVEDIKAHSLKVKEPTYTFLWGDMLAWGVCVDRDVKLGMFYINQSAKQGLLPAIEQLGRYYEHGTFVQKNKNKALVYYREAALQGFIKAQLHYVDLLLAGYGSPLDYQDAYHALFSSIIADKKTHQKAQGLLSRLAKKMPDYILQQARKK
ncbi:flagellar protein MotX [Psychromonas sp. PRT-SC03]|nr:flagellar protein MotX [Psychromonas sp. PRT-SC03]